MTAATLERWLDRLLERDPDRIEPGVTRMRRVTTDLLEGKRLGTIVSVAGTNGKGSSVAMAAAICRAAGYRTGSYTSPHLVDVRERFQVDGRPVDAETLVEAFEAIEAHPDSGALTYFEWLTVAAFIVFAAESLDVWVLEVGLGGRLDAVNALDADLALITNIGLDHQAWLGDSREAIGREKAGILRRGRPAVYADPDPVGTVETEAARIGADLLRLGEEIVLQPPAEDAPGRFALSGARGRREFRVPALAGSHQVTNAAGVVALLQHPRSPLEIPDSAVEEGLGAAGLAGRLERCERDGRHFVLDVAHNGEAARALADALERSPARRRLAVFSVLSDKPVADIVGPLASLVEAWWVAELSGPRAMPLSAIEAALSAAGASEVFRESDLAAAYNSAIAASSPGDEIVIFGSFHVVGPLRDLVKGPHNERHRPTPAA